MSQSLPLPDVYQILEKHIQPLRQKGYRVTGFVEAVETIRETCTLAGTTVETQDFGLSLTFTVDDGHAKAVGATQRAAVEPSLDDLDRLVGDALFEAESYAKLSQEPQTSEPGDYTVVLHPAAVMDILRTTLGYGLLDRRKIDEERTYLSHHMQSLRFPEDLELKQSLVTELPNGAIYQDLPLNGRLLPCESLNLIRDGRIQDLYVDPFWAKTKGVPETFTAYDGPALQLSARRGGQLHGKHRTLQDLIQDTKDGFFVANTWYLRMVAEMDGIITGMTRDGLFAIKDGRLTHAAQHMRWHDNPFRMLQNVSGLTSDKMLLGRSRLAGITRDPLTLAPGLRVEKFHFSSATKF